MMKARIFAAVGLLLILVLACESPSIDKEATPTLRPQVTTVIPTMEPSVTPTMEPSTPVRTEGELNITVYRNIDGFQTVGAQIEVFAIDQRQSPIATSNQNPASFTLAPSAYDVVAKYRHDVHGQMERIERKVVIEPGKKTEVSISFNLGEVELTALKNLGGGLAVGTIFEVYPTVQHEQPLIKISENPAIFSLTEGTYDILVIYPHGADWPPPIWVEGLSVVEGQTATSTTSLKLGILRIASFKATGGYQTVGAWIRVYPTSQSVKPLVSSDKNPAMFSLPEGDYDVVATYNISYSFGWKIEVTRTLDDVTILEGETTEREISFGLGALAVVALNSGGEELAVTVEVYPTFQHDQPIVEVHCQFPPGACVVHSLEAGVYDVYVEVYLNGWQQAWQEGVAILEGEVKEITLQFQ